MRALRNSIALISACGILAAAAPLRAFADAIVLVWESSGAPSDVNDGVQLGAAEAQQTAALLGRTVRVLTTRGASPRRSPLHASSLAAPPARSGRVAHFAALARDAPATRPFVTIVSDTNGVSLKADACTFRLSPSPAERDALLTGWKKRTGSGGHYRIAVWHPSLKQFGGSDLNERFTRRFHHPMTDGAWLGWIAVKAAVEAALRASGGPCPAIENLQFDGHKGASLSFVNRVLQQPLYVVETSGAGEKVVAQVGAK